MDNHKLGIFGDSFATTHSELVIGTPWTKTLAKKITATGEYFSHPGTSSWWAYQRFIKFHENFDTIVFVYSQHNRWHHLSEECHGMHHLTFEKSYNSVPEPSAEREKISKILYDAYRYVASEEFDLFVFQNIFDNVNKICKNKNIRVVNVLPFEDGRMIIDYSSREGPILYNLVELSTAERMNLTKQEDDAYWKMICAGDKRPCHMTEYHNDLVSTVISELLLRNDTTIKDIMTDSRVSTDPIYAKMYI